MTSETRPGAILVLTRIWPTPQRPSLGTYVQQRVSNVPGLRVVRPRWPRLPRPLIYPLLLLAALRVPGPLAGVESHMLFPTGLVGLLVARFRRVPLLVYAHGGDVRDWERRSFVVRWLLRAVARRADLIVANSEDTAAHLRGLGRESMVIPPGVDLDRFAPSPRPAVRRVLYLGGRSSRKGYAVAARLAHTLVGPMLRELDPREIPALMAEHDIVLVPSVAEPFGLVAVEAMASGRWVVARAVGGLREIVQDGTNGTLVADGDFEGALARVPDYDPRAVAATAERYSLHSWQQAMREAWDGLLNGAPHG